MLNTKASNFLLLVLIAIVIFFGVFYNNKLNTIEKQIMDDVQNYTITMLENHNDMIDERINDSNLIIEQNFKNYNEMFQKLVKELMKKQNENKH